MTETNTLTNDIASPPFVLNVLTFGGTTPNAGNGTAVAAVTIAGTALNFVNSSLAATPVINLNSNRSNGQPVNYNVQTNVTLGAGTLFTGNGTATFNFSGIVSGTSGFSKSGNSTLTLSNGSNDFSGGISLSAGGLSIGHTAALASNIVSVTGNSAIAGTSGTISNTINVSDNITLSLRAIGAANSTTTFSSAITGTGVGITHVAGATTSTVELSSTGNNFTGNLTLPTGTGTNDFFSFASIGDGGSIVYGRSSWRSVATYTGAAALPLSTRSISLASTFGGFGNSPGLDGGGNPINMFGNNGAGVVTISPDMVVASSALNGVFYFGGSNAGNNTFSGVIADNPGAGTLGIGKWDAGKWILSNSSNSFQGNVYIGGGTLTVPNLGALGNGTVIQLGFGGNTGTLEYTGSVNASTAKQTVIGNLNNNNHSGNSTILNNGDGTLSFTNVTFNSQTVPFTATNTLTTRARTLTLGGSNTGANEIQGVIQDNNTTGSNTAYVGVTKTDNGTWLLSGNNTYGGNTTISGGTLKVGNANALGFGYSQKNVATGTTTVSSGFTLDLNGTTGINEPIILSGTGIGGNGALINTGAAASIGIGIAGINIGGTTTGSGYSAAPTVNISGTGSGATAVATLGLTAASFGPVTLTGTRTGTPVVTITGGGGTGATATVNVTTGAVTITNPGQGHTSAPTITVTGVTGGTISFNSPTATDFTVSGVQMTAPGTGYTGTPTYTFSGGNAVAGSLTRSTVTLAANSSIGGTGDITINAVVSESGAARALTKVGANTLTFAGANTYTGATTITEGTLRVNGSTSASSAVAVNGTSTLGGTGTIGGTVTVDATANIAPGASVGTLTINGGLNVSAPATGGAGKLKFELDSIATSDKIIVGGTLTIGTGLLDFSDFEFSALPGLENGTYTLMSYGTLAASNSLAGSGLAGAIGGGTGTLQLNTIDKTVELVVSGVVAGDVTPPVWEVTWPKIDGVDSTTFTARAKIDEAGTSYYVVLANNAPAPTSAQVKAGTDSSNVAAFKSGSIVLAAATENTAVVTGLVSGTAYDVYFVAEDATPNLQTSPVKVDVTTQTFYEDWANGAAFDADANGDGVKNGLAFLLGAANPNAAVTLPVPTENNGDLVLNFSCLNDANRGGAKLYVEHSDDVGISDTWLSSDFLSDSPGAPVNGVTLSVTPGTPTNSVTATIDDTQAVDGKLFGRLRAENP